MPPCCSAPPSERHRCLLLHPPHPCSTNPRSSTSPNGWSSRGARRRRCRRRGRGALAFAVGRGARRRGRGMRARRGRRSRPARAGRQTPGDGVDQRSSPATAPPRWPSARWRWRASRRRTSSPASPTRAAGARFSRSRSDRSRSADRRRAGSAGARGRSRPGSPCKGVDQIGRRVGLGRHRRHGAGHQPRLSRRLSRLAATACR